MQGVLSVFFDSLQSPLPGLKQPEEALQSNAMGTTLSSAYPAQIIAHSVFVNMPGISKMQQSACKHLLISFTGNQSIAYLLEQTSLQRLF